MGRLLTPTDAYMRMHKIVGVKGDLQHDTDTRAQKHA